MIFFNFSKKKQFLKMFIKEKELFNYLNNNLEWVCPCESSCKC